MESLLLNVLLAGVALRLGWVDGSGAGVGVALGTAVLWGAGWDGFLLFVAFVALGSGLTRWGYARKQALGVAQERGGRRSWNHALAKGGVAALCALLARLLDEPLPWKAALTTALATALADTGGSEVGPLWGRRAFHPLTFRPLAPGQPGARSWAGCGVEAGLAAGMLGLGALLGSVPAAASPWLWGASLMALWGESLLGAWPWARRTLGHDGRNFVATAMAALLALGTVGRWG